MRNGEYEPMNVLTFGGEGDESIYISFDNELYIKFGTHPETEKLVLFPAHVERISVHPHPNNAQALSTGVYPYKMDFSFHLENVDFKVVVHCKGELAPGTRHSARLPGDRGQAVTTQKYKIRRIVSIELDRAEACKLHGLRSCDNDPP